MAKVHRLIARKDYPKDGIQKGETYYKWSLRSSWRGTTYRSKTYPKPWQLTSSPFRQTIYQIEDQLSKLESYEMLEDIINQIGDLRDETQESLDNIPDNLQQGVTGELLQERVEGCEAWISELESVDPEDEDSLETIRETTYLG